LSCYPTGSAVSDNCTACIWMCARCVGALAGEASRLRQYFSYLASRCFAEMAVWWLHTMCFWRIAWELGCSSGRSLDVHLRSGGVVAEHNAHLWGGVRPKPSSSGLLLSLAVEEGQCNEDNRRKQTDLYYVCAVLQHQFNRQQCSNPTHQSSIYTYETSNVCIFRLFWVQNELLRALRILSSIKCGLLLLTKYLALVWHTKITHI
jgi:hypothetical protein